MSRPGTVPGWARGAAGRGLTGKTVLVTGPARGIGAAAAELLAERGANVALAGIEPERLSALAAAIGPRAAWFEADVRDRAAIDRAVAGTLERFGAVDAVVANAGIAPVGTVLDIDPDAFEATIDVNLLGVWRAVRAALPELTRRRGYVLMVSSLAAVVHLRDMAHYAAAKAGVHAFAESLRMELRGTGTAVGVAYFGFVDTDMVRDGFEEAARRGAMPRVRPRLMPVGVAAEAIATAIERRSPRVVLPRWAAPALLAPGLFQRVAELGDRLVRPSTS